MNPESRPGEREIDELLDAVASGRPLDWDREESRAAQGDSKRRVRTLHDLARVAEFHRGLQQGADASGLYEGGRWGELLLLERAGAGADGEVYRAWDPALRREVALKLSRAGEAPAAMLDEARSLARVRDPHVVVVHGAAEHDGRAGFWMEYLRGPSLASELARRGPLPSAEVARLGAQLARALVAVHAAGALHRDLKPANVILEGDGRFVLVDFGLGMRADADGAQARPFSGTPMFMSPQRLAGAAATVADDLYALGVTLRWALAGRTPFRAESLAALRAEAAAGPAVALASECPDAPDPLVAAIERLMAPAPAARFESAGRALEAFAALAPIPDSSPAVAPARARAPATHIAGALLLAVVATIAALAMWPRRVAGPPPAFLSPAAPVPYDVSATLLRVGGTAVAPLVEGDRVVPGDWLALEFRATRRAWVYVLNADDRGETYLLFPQPLFERTNPLPADSLVRLPGTRAGRESGWVVTSRGGHEHFLLVASPSPVPELEAELGRLPAPSPDRPVVYARVGAAPIERLRGVGGVAELPAAPAGHSDPFARFRALAGREQGVRGVWVRQVTLRNPER